MHLCFVLWIQIYIMTKLMIRHLSVLCFVQNKWQHKIYIENWIITASKCYVLYMIGRCAILFVESPFNLFYGKTKKFQTNVFLILFHFWICTISKWNWKENFSCENSPRIQSKKITVYEFPSYNLCKKKNTHFLFKALCMRIINVDLEV